GRARRVDAVRSLLTALKSVDDRNLQHASIYALIEIADRNSTAVGLKVASANIRRAALVALDQMENGGLTKSEVIPLLSADHPALQQSAWEIALKRPEWLTDVLGEVREGLLDPDTPQHRLLQLQESLCRASHVTAIQSFVAEMLEHRGAPLATRIMLMDV